MNYIGSKTKLLNFIQESIEEFTKITDFDKKIFCDLFAGTGTVGSHFKKLGCQTISNDVLFFSYIINKNLIENNHLFSPLIIKNLNKNLHPKSGFITKNYSPYKDSNRMYFTVENAQKIDAYLDKIYNLYNKHQISDSEFIFLLSSLIKSADKIANTASVYAAYLKQFKKTALNEIELIPAQPVIGKYSGKSYNKKAEDLIQEIKGDILFLDPPYNTRRYDTNYHILETIALNDNPVLHGKTGLREEESQKKSAFSSKQKAMDSLEEIIANAEFKYIFLTYNTDGIISAENIERIFKKYGRFDVKKKEYKRFKADTSEERNYDNSDLYECIYCLRK